MTANSTFVKDNCAIYPIDRHEPFRTRQCRVPTNLQYRKTPKNQAGKVYRCSIASLIKSRLAANYSISQVDEVQ
ncbi:MAG: hypothetical protein HC786_18260 [Richelia sp. CSU_2_1]|nr:hypothetical protein [Richelia sp. CSU_2_1]